MEEIADIIEEDEIAQPTPAPEIIIELIKQVNELEGKQKGLVDQIRGMAIEIINLRNDLRRATTAKPSELNV